MLADAYCTPFTHTQRFTYSHRFTDTHRLTNVDSCWETYATTAVEPKPSSASNAIAGQALSLPSSANLGVAGLKRSAKALTTFVVFG